MISHWHPFSNRYLIMYSPQSISIISGNRQSHAQPSYVVVQMHIPKTVSLSADYFMPTHISTHGMIYHRSFVPEMRMVVDDSNFHKPRNMHCTTYQISQLCALFCCGYIRYSTDLWLPGYPYTAECHYNAVQFITILPSALRWQQQNVNQTSKSQHTPHTSPLRASYRVSILKIWEKINRVITAPHCTSVMLHWHWGNEVSQGPFY